MGGVNYAGHCFGASRAGLTLVRRLIAADYDVVLVDPNSDGFTDCP